MIFVQCTFAIHRTPEKLANEWAWKPNDDESTNRWNKLQMIVKIERTLHSPHFAVLSRHAMFSLLFTSFFFWTEYKVFDDIDFEYPCSVHCGFPAWEHRGIEGCCTKLDNFALNANFDNFGPGWQRWKIVVSQIRRSVAPTMDFEKCCTLATNLQVTGQTFITLWASKFFLIHNYCSSDKSIPARNVPHSRTAFRPSHRMFALRMYKGNKFHNKSESNWYLRPNRARLEGIGKM
jgi:hypothetical protein